MPASIFGANLYCPRTPSLATTLPSRARSRALKSGERPTSMPQSARPALLSLSIREVSGQIQPPKSVS
jgi:hypothetical protein